MSALTARGFEASDALRAALSGAKDLAFIRSIVQKAAVAASAEEILTAL